MKKSIICKAMLSLALLGSAASHAAIISNYNKGSALADGWSIVYQGGYGTQFNYAGVLGSIASGSMVALASSSSTNALEFDLFAGTSLTNLMRFTATNQTFYADDAYWYRNSSSVGFALNAPINQRSADVVGAGWGYNDGLGDGDFRLSWHGGATTVNGGWRSGLNTNLNSNNVWQRYVLVYAEPTPPQDVPEPASLALLGLGLGGLVAARRKRIR